MTNIKTIILDFGGVIIDLDFNRTISAFSKLTDVAQDLTHSYYFIPSAIQGYEKELISDVELRTRINKLLNVSESASRTARTYASYFDPDIRAIPMPARC